MSWPGSTPTASATAAQKPSTCSSRRPAALPTASEPSSTTGSESCSPPPDNGPTADHPPTLKSEEPLNVSLSASLGLVTATLVIVAAGAGYAGRRGASDWQRRREQPAPPTT